ncbi:MAG: PKD domain-containing protein [Candidatus Altiarchaeota archaeon]|nr:PKD domain-containing protein [Candidatus Altiarchaeota archaeon]
MLKTITTVTLIILLLGCIGTQEESTEYEEPIMTEPIVIELGDLEYGQTTTEDLDGDGTTDRITYATPREEIEENIYLQKTMTYDIQGEEMNGTLLLYFENVGNEEKTITHIENIPKSFASHISQLSFSIQPTELLEEDPVVSWEQRIMQRNNIGIVIKAGAEKIKSAALEKLGSWLNTDYKPTKDEAAEAAVGEKVGDVEFEALMMKAEKMPAGAQKDNLRIKIMEENPGKFMPEDCAELSGVFRQVCLAVIREDSTECEKIQNEGDEEACKKMLFNSLKNKNCKTIKEPLTQDLCIHKAAVSADHALGCEDIRDPEKLYSKEICRAEVTQEIEWCQKLATKAKEVCCDKIIDQERRRECLGEAMEITPEELRGTKNTKYRFTAKSYNPPQNPLYSWNFAGDKKETEKAEIEYTFTEADTYEITVELLDEDTGKVVDKGYSTAVITEPAYKPQTDYERLLSTNQMGAQLSVYGKRYEIREGQRRDYNDSNSASCSTRNANLTWNGRLFSVTDTWEVTQPDGRKVPHKVTIEGAIAENETRIEWLTCEYEWIDTERKELYSDTYVAKFQIKDVEMKGSGFYSEPSFSGRITGSEVRFHVNYGPEIHQEATRGSDKRYTYHSFTEIYWESTYKEPTLQVTFSTRRS